MGRRRGASPPAVRRRAIPNAPIRIISGFPARHHRRHFRPRGRRQDRPDPRPAVRGREPARRGLEPRRGRRSPARRKDGYTLFIGSAANVINAAKNPNLNFDFYKDFTPITLITSTPTVLAVTPELGVKSVKELIALAKAKPDALSFGSSGVGELDASGAGAVQLAGAA